MGSLDYEGIEHNPVPAELLCEIHEPMMFGLQELLTVRRLVQLQELRSCNCETRCGITNAKRTTFRENDDVKDPASSSKRPQLCCKNRLCSGPRKSMSHWWLIGGMGMCESGIAAETKERRQCLMSGSAADAERAQRTQSPIEGMKAAWPLAQGSKATVSRTAMNTITN